jgi:F420-dependent oxidoreductase-like protein
MQIGVFIGDAGGESTGVDALRANARDAEARGLATGWVPHIPWSLDSLTALALVGPETERIELGTAVIPTYSRHPLGMAQQALSTQAACDGRLTLGIGPSHPVVIENMYGLSYDKPYRHTREYLEVLDAAFACTGQVDHDGDLFHVHAMLRVPDASPVPVLIAALAPLMLALAGSRAQGTITWMADERALGEHVVPRIADAATEAGRPTPRVVIGLPVAVCDDAAAGRDRAAHAFSVYDHIPTYQRIIERGDADGPADVVAVGTEAEVTARLQSYRDAGATDLAASVFTVGADEAERARSRERTLDLLASLASSP